MKIGRIVLAYIVFAIVFVAFPLLADERPIAGQGVPISRYLNPDGSLNLPPEGIPGGINPSGFRLASVQSGPPRFESVSSEPCAADDNWDPRFSLRGMNGGVTALAWDGKNLYAGGDFTSAGGVVANHIAKWDGTAWSALGAGMGVGPNGMCFVSALAWDGTNLYAGGLFTTAGVVVTNSIAKWDGSTWSALGAGMGGTVAMVSALAWDGTNLYAGGYFATAGGVAANNIAKWNGTNWSALGTGMGGGAFGFGSVSALAWGGGSLYAGGSFTTAGGMAAKYIAKWNGAAWTTLGTGMGSTVSALVWTGNILYAGGGFTTAGGVAANTIAKWNGTSWSALGTGMTGNYAGVGALVWDGTHLYAGGYFTTAGGMTVNSIAKWNGTAWIALGTGMSDESSVSSLAWNGTQLFAGGGFSSAGGVRADCIARWNGAGWAAMPSAGEGINYSDVSAFAWDGTNLYAGGDFFTAGGAVARNIAKWDGTTWSALGTGMDYAVSALAWDGINLYAGGYFTTAGGVTANYIAKWDGASWSALGSGTYNTVNALVWDGANLYAGGDFREAGGVTADHIARWNGTAWSALGTGMNNGDAPSSVHALAWDGTNLYAGGDFQMAGGVMANRIAKWNGTAWSALGTGMDDTVTALAWDGTNLYVGGLFTMAGGVAAEHVAKWDGAGWSALGLGLSGGQSPVWALTCDGTNLYAGGDFSTAGTVAANRIAKWNGTDWNALGSGANDLVFALAWIGSGSTGSLYAGGTFTTMGNKVSNHIARWSPCAITCTATVPDTGSIGSAIVFQSTATPSGCTGAPTFAWAFGDGATSTEQNPSHTYTSAGVFDWTLTVTADAAICSKIGTVTVKAGPPGDCDGNGTVSIGEVQKAINMFLGTLAPACGVDCNGGGTVSIGEVQKVINGFLGLAAIC